ncbi:hypothetical protein JRQ81_017608 [Phrynocephalus forsythii]|uniref:Uncharacterized protein n=1 Tax=Phrynocephalus forsythii TaxID=171643 RepID=A0A9Q0XRA3_9SAUR|nr:hypothetical protein JRQ81_017608 [Phrynocephalus forsythii]
MRRKKKRERAQSGSPAKSAKQLQLDEILARTVRETALVQVHEGNQPSSPSDTCTRPCNTSVIINGGEHERQLIETVGEHCILTGRTVLAIFQKLENISNQLDSVHKSLNKNEGELSKAQHHSHPLAETVTGGHMEDMGKTVEEPSKDSKDPFTSTWDSLFVNKLHNLGFTLDYFANFDFKTAYLTIKAKLFEEETELLSSNLNWTCSPRFFNLSPVFGHDLCYFRKLINPNKRRAFMLARLNIFPSSVLSGRYLGIPSSQRLCKFCQLEPDTVPHILCHCPAHTRLRKEFLDPIMSMFSGPPEEYTSFLLRDNSEWVTLQVADFLVAVINKK